MTRRLSERERNALITLIDHGTPFDEDRAVSDADRRRWREQVATVRAGERCGCGQCPSVELEGPDGPVAEVTDQVVLEASTPAAMLLLFVDDDRLSYLELAPLGEDVVAEFPHPDEIGVG